MPFVGIIFWILLESSLFGRGCEPFESCRNQACVKEACKNSKESCVQRICQQRQQLPSLSVSREIETDVVVMSSLSLPAEEIAGVKGVRHYEQRQLWELLRTLNDSVQVVYVSGPKVPDLIKNHYLNLLPKKACQRIHFVSAEDESDRPAVLKILDDESLIQEIKSQIRPQKPTYLEVFVASEAEFRLAQKLEIPLAGPDKSQDFWKTKSGNRILFKQFLNDEEQFADGEEDIQSEDEALSVALRLWVQGWKKEPPLKKIVFKQDEGVSGKGNAFLTLPNDKMQRYVFDDQKLEFLRKAFESYASGSWDIPAIDEKGSETQKERAFRGFWERLYRKGGVVEEFLRGTPNKISGSPSAQGLIQGDGNIELLSTHSQILDRGEFLGAYSPPPNQNIQVLVQATMDLGRALFLKGGVGYYAVDFMDISNKFYPIEINYRQGGTTHLQMTARLLSGARVQRDGSLRDQEGRRVFYFGTDNAFVQQTDMERHSSFSLASLLTLAKERQLLLEMNRESKSIRKGGIVFHLMGAFSEYGKVGFTAIDYNNKASQKWFEEAQELVRSFCRVGGKCS